MYIWYLNLSLDKKVNSARTLVFRVLLQDRRYLQRELRNEFLIRVGKASHISCMNACYPLLSSTVTYLDNGKPSITDGKKKKTVRAGSWMREP